MKIKGPDLKLARPNFILLQSNPRIVDSVEGSSADTFVAICTTKVGPT